MIDTPDAIPHRRGLLRPALLAAFVYMVLMGGTALGEGVSELRLLNGLLGGALILIALIRLRPESFDRTDRLVVGALVLFAVAGILSEFPRQSFDAVLAAVAFAAAFLLARRELRSATARRLLMVSLMGMSAVMTFVTFVRWVLPVLEWWAGTGWTVIPPLSFELAGFPWGHRHDLTLLIVLLYPAWWVGNPSPMRRTLAAVIGALAVPIVLVDGSRAVWLAMAVATAVVAAAWAVRARPSRRARRWIVVGTVLFVGMLIVTGLGVAVLQRGLSPTSLGYRTAMWGPILEQWFSRPIAGNGPGSFGWVLQLTDYFDTNSWAPRHPDNAAIQVIAEAGLLGLAALALIVAALAPAAWRSDSDAARWAVVTYAIACIGANPTDFAFLVVLAIAWAAYAAPRAGPTERNADGLRTGVARASVACLAVISVGFGLTAAGSFAFDRAREAVADGDFSEAVAALDTAADFDPGLAVYRRERGAANYVIGNIEGAVADFGGATRLNPADDLAWRSLGLAYAAAGSVLDSTEAIARAVDLQRSDTTNLMLKAAAETRAGLTVPASATLAEVVHAWPSIVHSVGWSDVLPEGVSSAETIEQAVERWWREEPIPEVISDQGIWLTSTSQRTELESTAVDESTHSDALSKALAASIRCEDISGLVSAMSPVEQRSFLYWWLLARAAYIEGGMDEHAIRMAQLMGRPLSPSLVDYVINPLNEIGFGRFGWGYRRAPINWPSVGEDLPSPTGGMMRWIHEPEEAVTSADLEGSLPDCIGARP